MLLRSCPKEQKKQLTTSLEWLAYLFMISGFAALIYQVVWQRVLFSTFGINVESVTIIVSLFMLGLGVGALVGGVLSKIFEKSLIKLFILLEIGIGIFGIFSIDVIKSIAKIADTTSVLSLSLHVYLILFLPTLMMGATLPILVSYIHKHYRNVGKTVGILYAFNTLGSAIAAFITVSLIFVLFGLKESVFIAALCNFTIAYLIYLYSKQVGNKKINIKNDDSEKITSKEKHHIPYIITLLISAAIGYISLSQEILWYRAFNIASGSAPQIFGYVLASFLVGVALGALKAKKVCEQDENPIDYILKALILSSVIYYFSFIIYGMITDYLGEIGLLVGYFFVGIVAFLTGSIFPVLTHIGINKNTTNIGSSLSWVYFANIIGATAGPIVTGFILLDIYSLTDNVRLISFLSILLTIFVLIISHKQANKYKKLIPALVVTIILAITGHNLIYNNFIERIHFSKVPSDKRPLKYVEENRSGVITIINSDEGDIIYGSGVYDGRYNIDPKNNSNMISRAYALAVLHPEPKRTLEIGLSGGAWAKVFSMHEEVESMNIVEINKGYIDITKNYPEIATIFEDPKISVVIDDGRRWLDNYDGEKFDFILMNTTHYWRNNSSNLLSEDFLKLCKQHLKPGGVIYYNTTGNSDVVYTATKVFKHVTKFANFVAASDVPFDMTDEQKRANLLKFKNNKNEPIFDLTSDEYLQAYNEIVYTPLMNKDELLNNYSYYWKITDNNMASEYKSSQHFYKPHYNIFAAIRSITDN